VPVSPTVRATSPSAQHALPGAAGPEGTRNTSRRSSHSCTGSRQAPGVPWWEGAQQIPLGCPPCPLLNGAVIRLGKAAKSACPPCGSSPDHLSVQGRPAQGIEGIVDGRRDTSEAHAHGTLFTLRLAVGMKHAARHPQPPSPAVGQPERFSCYTKK
jgi:hypothetical protein